MNHARPTPTGAVRGVVRTTIDIAAPPERVFRAITDPAERAAWWGGPTDAAEGAPRVLDPPRVFEHAWGGAAAGDATAGEAPDGGASTVRYELEPAEVDGAPGTRLTVTHTGPAIAGVVACAGRLERLARRCGGRGAAPAATSRVASRVVYLVTPLIAPGTVPRPPARRYRSLVSF